MNQTAAGSDGALLSLAGVRKSFGATAALADATLSVEPGEVHALLGENGAGKSTAIAIVAGLVRRDGGEMRWAGEAYVPSAPEDAKRAGIALVPQEPTLALHMDAIENVTLGAEPTRGPLVDRAGQRAMAEAAFAKLRVSIRLDVPTSELPPAERQLVSIARALAAGNARLVILDEPTSSLAAHEASRVLEAVRALAASGVAVLYVSHHLEEVVRVARRFTVFRAGSTVHRGEVSGLTARDLAELVVGRRLATRARRAAAEPRGTTDQPLLETRAIAGTRLPREASLAVRPGEILGIAGLVGAGRTELVRAVFGLDRVAAGEVRVKGFPPDRGATPAARLRQRVGLLSEDRKTEGIAQSMTIADNMTLSRYEPVTRVGLVSDDAHRALAHEMIATLGIRAPDPMAPASSLSGGNQQKVAIARLLHHDVEVLLLDEPTRGIDPGSRDQIYGIVFGLADAGKAVVWISSQLDELLLVSDRIAILKDGKLAEPREASALDEHGLLAEIGGAS